MNEFNPPEYVFSSGSTHFCTKVIPPNIPSVSNDCFVTILTQVNTAVQTVESFMTWMGVIFLCVGMSC